mgnify:FL=1
MKRKSITILDYVSNDFSGCVFVEKNNKTIVKEAFGYAENANKRENNVDTRFPTASAGKVFVATAILSLIEQKKLSFKTSLNDVLSFDLGNIDRSITIEQLLNHTSSVPDYFDESIMSDYAMLWQAIPNYTIRSSKDLLPLFTNKPLQSVTNNKFQYNNSGYVLLGLILEEISQMPLDEYLTVNIFNPCKMNSTGYFELDRLPENCANAYIYDKQSESYYTNIYSVDAKGSGAGGAFITVGDVHQFWRCLLKGKIISKNMLDRMLSVQASDGDDYYGYGVWLKKEGQCYIPYFTGSDPGVSFMTSFDVQDQLIVTVVSNKEQNVWKIHNEIRKVMKQGEKNDEH